MTNYFYGPWSSRTHRGAQLRIFREVFPGKPCLYDLGAAGGTPPPFLFLQTEIDIVNFEPDKSARTEGNRQTYPIAIGPAEFNKIYLNKRPTTSSLLPANKTITSRYDWHRLLKTTDDIFETLAVEPIETCPLDTAVTRFNLPSPDFLKIDVQGLSLEVLEGAAQTLANSALGIEIEVEFLESYLGQKTMGAVHEYLYAQGFEIFRLKNLNPWYYKTNLKLAHHTGQDTFCDLVYFRNIDSISKQGSFWSPARAQRHIEMLLLYDLTDSAAAFFEAFRRRELLSTGTAAGIENMICTWPGAVEFFYEPLPTIAKSRLKKILSTSPLDVLKAVRSCLRSS